LLSYHVIKGFLFVDKTQKILTGYYAQLYRK